MAKLKIVSWGGRFVRDPSEVRDGLKCADSLGAIGHRVGAQAKLPQYAQDHLPVGGVILGNQNSPLETSSCLALRLRFFGREAQNQTQADREPKLRSPLLAGGSSWTSIG